MNLVFQPPGPARPGHAERDRAANVTALLGPTNTGKTHYAIERMLAHSSGIIGLPLRLLAREVYGRVVEKAGIEAVALVTGEERIKPKNPRFWISTVEAMPRDLSVAFVAIDEVQLCADLDRGHVFTDRLLNRRGREETLILGASTMVRPIQQILPGIHILDRPRLSKLTFAGERKIARLPPRSAIVAFSAEEVYAIAEWIRRARGGAAVVLGALSPRTRNHQVEMYQNGEVDYIVATDAIGMGLNLDVDHIAFAGDRKYDGWHYRRLHPAEFGQIAGRAGRYMRDGTFGTTGRCRPFDEELVNALEEHRFDPLTILQWRNTALDFSTIPALQASLDRLPDTPGLTRAPVAIDQMVLDAMAKDPDVMRQAVTRADIARLWDVCQIPDYRKLSPSAHADMILSIFGFVVRAGKIPDDWFRRQIAGLDRIDGEIDTLSARIAQVRTWTYIANRPDWLKNPEYWQGVTRQVEDNLSDALHERLAQRFVDRRTSVLMRRLRENMMLEAEITATGDVMVEGQHVGLLHGFRFTADPQAEGEAARALNAAAARALASEIEGRANRVHEAVDEAFVLTHDGTIRWLGEAVGRMLAGEHILKPRVQVLADEQLTGAALELVQKRLDLWLAQHVTKLLGPVIDIETHATLDGTARGIGFQIAESLGVLERARVAEQMKALDQDGRAALRKLGVRFGAYHLYLPLQLKPAPRGLAAQLWALKHGGTTEVKGIEDVPHLAASGRTSFAADKEVAKGFYRAAGFRVCGERAVRVDILERLADLIRPAIAYRPGTTPGNAPAGTADGDGFVVTVGMTSLAGCSGENFAAILRSLGYSSQQRKGPAITVPLLAAAAMEPVKPVVAPGAAAAETTEAAPQEDRTAEPVVAEAVRTEPVVAAEPAVELVLVPAAEILVAETPAAAEAETAPEEAATAAEGAEAVAEPEPVAEVPLIEVWHPHRHSGHQGRRSERSGEQPRNPRHNRQHSRAAPPAAGDATPVAAEASGAPPGREEHRRRPSGERPRGEQRQGGERQGPRPPRDQAAAAAAVPDALAPAAPPAQREHRLRPEGRPPHVGRPQQDRGRGSDSRPRPEGRRDDERRSPPRGGTFATTEAAPSRERQPDPNSPFAKLLALKAQLESKVKKD